MLRATLLIAIAAVLAMSSYRSFAAEPAPEPADSGIIERLDAITKRLDAIERQLPKQASLASDPKLPGPISRLTEKLVELVDERVRLDEQLSSETDTAQGLAAPPAANQPTLVKLRVNRLRTQRTMAELQLIMGNWDNALKLKHEPMNRALHNRMIFWGF